MELWNNWNRYATLCMIPSLFSSFVVCTVSADLLVLLTWCFCASELLIKNIIKGSDAGRSNWSGFQLPGKLVSSDEHMCALSAGPHNAVRFGFCLLKYILAICVISLTLHASPLWPIRLVGCTTASADGRLLMHSPPSFLLHPRCLCYIPNALF